MIKYSLCILTLACTLVTGCTLLSGYVPPQQQGNVFSPEKVQQLQPGMNKAQVTYLLGTPVLKHVFDTFRWDYIYIHRNHGTTTQRHLVVYFADEKLTRYAWQKH